MIAKLILKNSKLIIKSIFCEPQKDKFGDQYSGPYRWIWTIIDILPNGNIKLLIKEKFKIVHPNKIRKIKNKSII